MLAWIYDSEDDDHYCNDKWADKQLARCLGKYQEYREQLQMLEILLEKFPFVFVSGRYLFHQEFETLSFLTIQIMDDWNVYPLELIDLILFSKHCDPNQLSYGKTLLYHCITKLYKPKKIVSILLEHPRLNINYVDKFNIHILGFLFRRCHEPGTQKLIELVLKRPDLDVEKVMESLPHVLKWSSAQDHIYVKLFLKDRSYYRRFLWRTKRLIFLARLKDPSNVWSSLPLEIIQMILVDFGWEKVQPPQFPAINNIPM